MKRNDFDFVEMIILDLKVRYSAGEEFALAGD